MYDCAQSAITFNNLNLPNYDIHSKQSRQQILFNFHKLSQSFLLISTKHIQKSKQQNQRINKLKQRILNCKQRISQFETTNQALIFVSPGEYPKKYKFDLQNNVSIFKEYLKKTQINKLDMNAHYQVKHQIQKLGEQSKLKINQLNNFIVFLLGQLQGKKKSIFQRSLHPSKRKQYTLGQVPSGVQYIDSLLLFNSHINPYRKYQLTNNHIQKRPQNSKNKQVQQSQKDQILIDRQLASYQKPKYQQQSIQFIRKEEELEMPDFDIDLGLDGIVDYNDMMDFNVDTGFEKNVQKKTVPQDPYANKNKNQNSNSKNINPSSNSTLPPPPSLNSTLPSPPSLNNTLPPPPNNLPPPPLGLNLPPPPPLGLNLPPPPLGLNLPPPPSLGMNLAPPPPLPILSNNNNKLPAPPAPPSGGGRSALLQQLQNPNPMARLRKTVTVQKGGINPTVSQNTSSTQNNQAGDTNNPKPARQMTFMEALQAKIKRRFEILNMEKQQSD